MKNGNHVELLAPAGNPDSFYGSVNAGADAVYLAGNRFGARAYADNFTTDELLECIRYGHLRNIKLYLTVNTLIKENEINELYDYMKPLYEAGLDAVIVQDFGVFHYLREHFPNLELHASTQMTLCSSFGARLLKEMGATRIVPARELSLRELKKIKENVDIELEVFIHGAMCYCYSGQCLFSSVLGGRSGNRGRCAQPCRLPYSVITNDKKSTEAYYLSLKDMCTIDYIPELLEAGIDSFKIEGRMKKPEYAAGVTAIYRKYIDYYYALKDKFGKETAKEKFCVEQCDRDNLKDLYIRSEIQDGYFKKHNGREMITICSPSYNGSNEKLLEKIQKDYLSGKDKLPVNIRAVFCEKEAAEITLDYQGEMITVTGETVETANKQPITEDNIRKQLGKLGDSSFYAEKMQIQVSNHAFYSLKQINELRRQAVFALENKLLSEKLNRAGKVSCLCNADSEERKFECDNYSYRENDFSISVETREQLIALNDWTKRHVKYSPSIVYVPGDLLENEEIWSICKDLANYCSVFVSMPYILREDDKAYLQELYKQVANSAFLEGFLIRSADGIGFLEQFDKKCKWHLDTNIYVWNRDALQQLGEKADSFCLPYELKASEQRKLLKSGFCFEKIIYGRIPMMITANCVLKTSDRCMKNNKVKSILVDRYEKEFPVMRNCRHCINTIYNSVPLSLHRELQKWNGSVRMRLQLTVEDRVETEKLLTFFLTGEGNAPEEYTTGHEKRGVE